MYTFIWEYVNGLTDNYHDGGGLIINAQSLEDARNSFKEEFPNMNECSCFTEEPDHVFPTQGDHLVIRFQDAGCC